MKLKEIVANMGDKAARESYGKSIPTFIYEPKMPQALRDNMDSKEEVKEDR